GNSAGNPSEASVGNSAGNSDANPADNSTDNSIDNAESNPAGVFRELSMELFKIEQYVGMVLQYLRLDSSSTDYLLKTYELDEIVKQAVRKYSRMFIGKRIGLDLKDLNCKVLTDEKWLAFVIEQVLSNALKYTREGTISIYMEQKSKDITGGKDTAGGKDAADGDDIAAGKTLVIEDTGIGIQAEDLPRVFDKGFTGYNGRADKKSTGIGLYLCRRILKKLSHTMSIESEVGSGTRVKIGLDSIKLGRE
ncbi:MAG: hypothetical protein HGA22_14175, partial [Clostridiales bacterium]|nr:hypothetical protein [Clostridiales bacterium]